MTNLEKHKTHIKQAEAFTEFCESFNSCTECPLHKEHANLSLVNSEFCEIVWQYLQPKGDKVIEVNKNKPDTSKTNSESATDCNQLSVTLWMLTQPGTKSFVAHGNPNTAINPKCPPYHLCPHFLISDDKMVTGLYRLDVEDIAKAWNKYWKKSKVKPIKVRINLEVLNAYYNT